MSPKQKLKGLSPDELHGLEQAAARMQWDALYEAASKGLLPKNYGIYKEKDKDDELIKPELSNLRMNAGKSLEELISLLKLSKTMRDTRESVERLTLWRAEGMRNHPSTLSIPNDTPGFIEAQNDYERNSLVLRRHVFQEWINGTTKNFEGMGIPYSHLINRPVDNFDTLHRLWKSGEELGIHTRELDAIASDSSIIEQHFQKRLNRLVIITNIHPYVVQTFYDEAQGFGVSDELLKKIETFGNTAKTHWNNTFPQSHIS